MYIFDVRSRRLGFERTGPRKRDAPIETAIEFKRLLRMLSTEKRAVCKTRTGFSLSDCKHTRPTNIGNEHCRVKKKYNNNI